MSVLPKARCDLLLAQGIETSSESSTFVLMAPEKYMLGMDGTGGFQKLMPTTGKITLCSDC